MLGISVQCDAGNTEEGSFFSHIARVCDNGLRLIYHISESQIGLGRKNMQSLGMNAQGTQLVFYIIM